MKQTLLITTALIITVLILIVGCSNDAEAYFNLGKADYK